MRSAVRNEADDVVVRVGVEELLDKRHNLFVDNNVFVRLKVFYLVYEAALLHNQCKRVFAVLIQIILTNF